MENNVLRYQEKVFSVFFKNRQNPNDDDYNNDEKHAFQTTAYSDWNISWWVLAKLKSKNSVEWLAKIVEGIWLYYLTFVRKPEGHQEN